MKNLTKSIVACLLSTGSLAFAAPVTTIINDTFLGGNDTTQSPARDIIGEPESFNIDNMAVTIDRATGKISVKIVTEWFDRDADGTSVGARPYLNSDILVNNGDLFISTNGWAPFGLDGGHSGDNASNGEGWEFVFDTSTKKIYGGSFGVSLSDAEMSPYPELVAGVDFRGNQETRRSTGGDETATGTVQWSTDAEVDADGIAYIIYNFVLADIGITDPNGAINLGFHWTMTCGNDVIEGGVDSGPGNEVPEPGIVLLFGLGLLGLGLRRRAS